MYEPLRQGTTAVDDRPKMYERRQGDSSSDEEERSYGMTLRKRQRTSESNDESSRDGAGSRRVSGTAAVSLDEYFEDSGEDYVDDDDDEDYEDDEEEGAEDEGGAHQVAQNNVDQAQGEEYESNGDEEDEMEGNNDGFEEDSDEIFSEDDQEPNASAPNTASSFPTSHPGGRSIANAHPPHVRQPPPSTFMPNPTSKPPAPIKPLRSALRSAKLPSSSEATGKHIPSILFGLPTRPPKRRVRFQLDAEEDASERGDVGEPRSIPDRPVLTNHSTPAPDAVPSRAVPILQSESAVRSTIVSVDPPTPRPPPRVGSEDPVRQARTGSSEKRRPQQGNTGSTATATFKDMRAKKYKSLRQPWGRWGSIDTTGTPSPTPDESTTNPTGVSIRAPTSAALNLFSSMPASLFSTTASSAPAASGSSAPANITRMPPTGNSTTANSAPPAAARNNTHLQSRWSMDDYPSSDEEGAIAGSSTATSSGAPSMNRVQQGSTGMAESTSDNRTWLQKSVLQPPERSHDTNTRPTGIPPTLHTTHASASAFSVSNPPPANSSAFSSIPANRFSGTVSSAPPSASRISPAGTVATAPANITRFPPTVNSSTINSVPPVLAPNYARSESPMSDAGHISSGDEGVDLAFSTITNPVAPNMNRVPQVAASASSTMVPSSNPRVPAAAVYGSTSVEQSHSRVPSNIASSIATSTVPNRTQIAITSSITDPVGQNRGRAAGSSSSTSPLALNRAQHSTSSSSTTAPFITQSIASSTNTNSSAALNAPRPPVFFSRTPNAAVPNVSRPAYISQPPTSRTAPNPAIPNLSRPVPSAYPTSGMLTTAQLDTHYVRIVGQQVMDQVREFGRPVCYTQGSFWIRSRSPFFGRAILATARGARATFPEGYRGPDVFVWLPRLLLKDDAAFRCPVCRHAEGCEVIGWPEPLLVRAMRPYYVVSRKYRCFRCVRLNGDTREGMHAFAVGSSYLPPLHFALFNHTQISAYFMPYDPRVLAQFPPHLAAEFPATITTNGAFDSHVVALVTGCLGSTRVIDLSRLLSVVLDMAKTPGAGGIVAEAGERAMQQRGEGAGGAPARGVVRSGANAPVTLVDAAGGASRRGRTDPDESEESDEDRQEPVAASRRSVPSAASTIVIDLTADDNRVGDQRRAAELVALASDTVRLQGRAKESAASASSVVARAEGADCRSTRVEDSAAAATTSVRLSEDAAAPTSTNSSRLDGGGPAASASTDAPRSGRATDGTPTVPSERFQSPGGVDASPHASTDAPAASVSVNDDAAAVSEAERASRVFPDRVPPADSVVTDMTHDMDVDLDAESTYEPSAAGGDTPMELFNMADQSEREKTATTQGIRNGEDISLGRESSPSSESPHIQLPTRFRSAHHAPTAPASADAAARADTTLPRADATSAVTSANVLAPKTDGPLGEAPPPPRTDEMPDFSSRTHALQTNDAPSVMPVHAPRQAQTKPVPASGDASPPSADEAPDTAQEHSTLSRIDEGDAPAQEASGKDDTSALAAVSENPTLARIDKSSAVAPQPRPETDDPPAPAAASEQAISSNTDEASADAAAQQVQQALSRTEDAPAAAAVPDQTPPPRPGKPDIAAGYTPPPPIPIAAAANIPVNGKNFLPTVLVLPYSRPILPNPVYRATRWMPASETSATDASATLTSEVASASGTGIASEPDSAHVLKSLAAGLPVMETTSTIPYTTGVSPRAGRSSGTTSSSAKHPSPRPAPTLSITSGLAIRALEDEPSSTTPAATVDAPPTAGAAGEPDAAATPSNPGPANVLPEESRKRLRSPRVCTKCGKTDCAARAGKGTCKGASSERRVRKRRWFSEDEDEEGGGRHRTRRRWFQINNYEDGHQAVQDNFDQAEADEYGGNEDEYKEMEGNKNDGVEGDSDEIFSENDQKLNDSTPNDASSLHTSHPGGRSIASAHPPHVRQPPQPNFNTPAPRKPLPSALCSENPPSGTDAVRRKFPPILFGLPTGPQKCRATFELDDEVRMHDSYNARGTPMVSHAAATSNARLDVRRSSTDAPLSEGSAGLSDFTAVNEKKLRNSALEIRERGSSKG
ncbi:hypothetical protein HDU96_010333 [Phlyctochytrium bullatum]|nr:hypothetical protein HDU96_010333 [Phlyctochytrium bullatum]